MRRWGEAPGDQFKQPLSLMVLRRWSWFTVGSLNPYEVVVKIGTTSADACGRRVSIARLFLNRYRCHMHTSGSDHIDKNATPTSQYQTPDDVDGHASTRQTDTLSLVAASHAPMVHRLRSSCHLKSIERASKPWEM